MQERVQSYFSTLKLRRNGILGIGFAFIPIILGCSDKYFVAPNNVIRIHYNVETFNDVRSDNAKMVAGLIIASKMF